MLSWLHRFGACSEAGCHVGKPKHRKPAHLTVALKQRRRREWGQGIPFLSFSVWLLYTSSSQLLVSTNISAIKSRIHQWVTRLLKHNLHNLIMFQSSRQLVLSLKLWPSGRCFILTSNTLDITGKIGVKAFWSWEVFSSQVLTCKLHAM